MAEAAPGYLGCSGRQSPSWWVPTITWFTVLLVWPISEVIRCDMACYPANLILGKSRRATRRMTSKPSRVLIIGSGPIVIGQAAEFDYSGSQACRSLREEGVHTILVNSNPATIMTDEGIADTIYIEPLTVDVISRIIERERPDGLLPTLGGQTGLNLAVSLADAGVLERFNVRALGTPIQTIRAAEDRELFRKLLFDIGEPVPESEIVTDLDQARAVAKQIGLPIVVRPAYTLGGTGGGIAHTFDELRARRARRTRRVAHPPGAPRTLTPRLERDRVRGDARRRGQLHHRLQHGEHRPDGRPHRRQHRRRAQPDAVRQGIPDAAHGVAQDHPRARDRGRLQRAVRAGTAPRNRANGTPTPRVARRTTSSR